MGYTHSHYRIRATPQLAADTRAILAAAARLGIKVRGPDGTGQPHVTARRIALNGDAASGQRLDALWLDADGDPLDHWFTKTERLPYDTVVTAVLTAAYARTGQVPGSNGRAADWAAGITLYEQACGPLHPDVLDRLRTALDHPSPNTGPDPEEILARNHRPAPGPGPGLRKQAEQEDPEPAP